MSIWRVENDDDWFVVYKDGVHVSDSSNGDQMADVLTDAFYDANTRIAELEAERRWIPVSERLPEEDKRVVLYSHGVMAVGWGRYELDIWYWECWDDKWSSWDTPTHWMPLPEPPEVKQ